MNFLAKEHFTDLYRTGLQQLQLFCESVAKKERRGKKNFTIIDFGFMIHGIVSSLSLDSIYENVCKNDDCQNGKNIYSHFT